MKLGIIIGSMRKERQSTDILDWILSHISNYNNIVPVVLDIKEYSLPFFGEDDKKELADPWRIAVKDCDSFIFLAPEFNHSISGSLKNALDLLDWELHHKPAAFIGYGLSANGGRAVEHLKSICASYSMLSVAPNILISLLEDVKVGSFQPRAWHNDMAKLMIDEIIELQKYSKDYLGSYMDRTNNRMTPIDYNEEWTGFSVPGLKGFCHTRRKK